MSLEAGQSVVILGSGQAGAWAAHTLRAEGFTGRVSLVGDELHMPYERPALSKSILAGESDLAAAQVFTGTAFLGLALDWHPSVTAVDVDRAGKKVALSNSQALTYDKLIFCTGGRARVPAIEGIGHPNVFTLRTIEDSLRLKARLQGAGSVCIVGGGWIGLEVASTAAAMGKRVSVLERGSALCKRVLPPAVSASLLALHRERGVDVRLNAEVTAIQRDADRLIVCATTGDVTADVVVVGAGMTANDELAARAGLRCDRGIVVDTHGVTSDPDILAAGDVAVAPNSFAQKPVRLESWENAKDQAAVAARTALGKEAHYDPLPWFWSDQHGVNLQLCGFARGDQRAVTRRLASPAGSQITFLLDGDHVSAAVALNAPRELRMARKLIERRTAVQAAQLEDPLVKISSL